MQTRCAEDVITSQIWLQSLFFREIFVTYVWTGGCYKLPVALCRCEWRSFSVLSVTPSCAGQSCIAYVYACFTKYRSLLTLRFKTSDAVCFKSAKVRRAYVCLSAYIDM